MNIKLLNEVYKAQSGNCKNMSDYYLTWNDWYKGNVDNFHTYNMVIGDKQTKCHRKTMNMPKRVCEEMTTLTLGNEVNVSFTSEDMEKAMLVQEQVEDILEYNSFNQSFYPFIEKGFVFGIGATIEFWQNNQITLDFIDADSLVPLEYENKKITKLAVVSQDKKGDKEYINTIFIHSIIGLDYQVEKMTYKSECSSSIGKLIKELDEQGNVIPNEVVYEKNAKPRFQFYNLPIGNNIDIHSPLAPSVFANSIDKFMAIDEVYDSLSNEIVLGRKKIYMPSSFVGTKFDPTTGEAVKYVDTSQGIFQVVKGNGENDKIEESNMTLRMSDHNLALDMHYKALSSDLGLDNNYLSLNMTGSAKTAKEIRFLERKTETTKAKYQAMFLQNLDEMIEVILEMLEISGVDFQVSLNYGIIESDDEKAGRLLNEYASGLISKEEYLREVKGWDEEKINQNNNELDGLIEPMVEEDSVEDNMQDTTTN